MWIQVQLSQFSRQWQEYCTWLHRIVHDLLNRLSLKIFHVRGQLYSVSLHISMRKKNPAEQCAQGVSNWNVLKLDDVTMMQPFSKVHAAAGQSTFCLPNIIKC